VKEDLMKSLVIYESMYGNTHLIATAIARGLSEAGEVRVIPLYQAVSGDFAGIDLGVGGGPTHAHGLSRARTRKAAAAAAANPEKGLTLEAHVTERGLRDWFASDGIGHVPEHGAAFDTRVDMPTALTGRAARGIAKRLRHHGCTLVTKPESFLVDKSNHIVAGEEGRARRWGAGLVQRLGNGELAKAV
jgi:hypothetical protein